MKQAMPLFVWVLPDSLINNEDIIDKAIDVCKLHSLTFISSMDQPSNIMNKLLSGRIAVSFVSSVFYADTKAPSMILIMEKDLKHLKPYTLYNTIVTLELLEGEENNIRDEKIAEFSLMIASCLKSQEPEVGLLSILWSSLVSWIPYYGSSSSTSLANNIAQQSAPAVQVELSAVVSQAASVSVNAQLGMSRS